jgi:hypothetical protein
MKMNVETDNVSEDENNQSLILIDSINDKDAVMDFYELRNWFRNYAKNKTKSNEEIFELKLQEYLQLIGIELLEIEKE